MNKSFIFGLACILLSVASAQNQCFQALQMTLPQVQKLNFDFKSNNWIAVERDLERFLPIAKALLSNCAGISLPESPRVQACTSDVTSIARLIAPILENYEDMPRILSLLYEVPKLLSSFYVNCIDYQESETLTDQVLKQTKQKTLERDMLSCFFNLGSLAPKVKQTVDTAIEKFSIETFSTDIAGVLAQLHPTFTSCGLEFPEISVKAASIGQCITGIQRIFVSLESLAEIEEDDLSKILIRLGTLMLELPLTFQTCGLTL